MTFEQKILNFNSSLISTSNSWIRENVDGNVGVLIENEYFEYQVHSFIETFKVWIVNL